MKKNKTKSVMVTSIFLERRRLLTKEKMESYCEGVDFRKDSVNDDLESLFEKILLGKEPDERAWTYFLPRLTEEELESVEREKYQDVVEAELTISKSDSNYSGGENWNGRELEKSWERGDICYLETFTEKNPDVDESEMMLSESDAKYVQGDCSRRTFVIKNSSKKITQKITKKSSNNNCSCCNCSIQ